VARTQLAGRIDLDEQAITEDLGKAAGFGYSEAYSDYVCGGPWKSCMLWAAGGDVGDGLITNYDHTRKTTITEYGQQLPYLRSVVEKNFNLERLNFARLAVIADSVTIPHRDLLELGDIPEAERTTHRMHLSLVTNDDCFFTQDNVVYRMRPGEVWFFDAAKVHGAGSLTPERRIHLILDFAAVRDAQDLVRFPLEPAAGIPAENVYDRPPLAEAERRELIRLAEIIDQDNYRDVFSIVIRKSYRTDGGEDFVWKTLDEIGKLSKNESVRAKIAELHRFFLMERSA